ncbi:M3 family metallopeptidase [Roseibacterium beibuensis]|uniref:M3 family metallopeptidase n=1 Tax=[Roseibacterium] beibuensis TaxID=1193142 RepID=UPI00217EC5E5|nr:M3 family metallopeptidase [Roseibacterium beibuensis]MCS6627629.1 M3 family metallopeptidase [Roseibacterium beibuensis]
MLVVSPPSRRSVLTGCAAGAALAALPRFANASSGTDVFDGVTRVADAAALADNPAYAAWTGPYGGVPAWDRIRVGHLKPALLQAMADQRENVRRIVANPDEPTFANTIAAFEASGRALERAGAIYQVLGSSVSTPELRDLEAELDGQLAAHANAINQDADLYRRIKAVHDAAEVHGLTPEQKRLAWLHHSAFVRAGAELDPQKRARVAQINETLAVRFSAFSQNLLADEETWITVHDRKELEGLPSSTVAAMSVLAAERGLDGGWIVVNTRSSVDPVLTYAADRDLRRRVWTAFVNRGDNGGPHDNKALITEILALRHERARLLGFESHAHWRLQNTMAGSPENAMTLLERVWAPAVARVHEEVADMQALADTAGDGISIEPWDYRFYQEKVRKARYDLDQNEVKPYLQLERLREGMFWAAGRNFGWRFEEVRDAPVWHRDVTVYRVSNADGSHRGLFYFDPFARSGKRSGAWMNQIRSQERFAGRIDPLVSNNENFVRAAPGEPVLISWDDAATLFHEFGHAMHGLASNVQYPALSGTAVPGDFLEFPSQMWELWLRTPEILSRFAVHVDTGAPIPAELVRKMENARHFNQGFATVEFVASALMDMRYHLAGPGPIDPETFERETLAQLGMPGALVMRHRSPQFAHVFSSDAYSAGYYSYLWADTLVADAGEAFARAPGGFYDPELSRRYFDVALTAGNTRDAAETYRAFMGRDPDPAALLRARGFASEGAAG